MPLKEETNNKINGKIQIQYKMNENKKRLNQRKKVFIPYSIY